MLPPRAGIIGEKLSRRGKPMRALLTLVACLAVGCARTVRTTGDEAVAEPDGPVIRVTASYPGANAKVVADTVAVPIEQQINGAEGLVLIESECRNDGSY